MLARTQLIRIQRSMYDRLREYARDYLGGLGPELKKYFREYQRDFGHFEAVSSKRELLSVLQKTHIVFCGDYHTLSQAQRTVIRLLRESLEGLKKNRRELVLALEMVQSSDNPSIEKFLSGKITESSFLEAIQFHQNWGFSWDNYQTLFEFAKANKIKVVGINAPKKGRHQSLRSRDRFAARIITDLTQSHPKRLVFVLVGDLHLARVHLPREVKKGLQRRHIQRRELIIHQNSERFYWKLVDRGLEHVVEVIRMRENVYCVMNTPPWVKLQSHLKWVELTSDENATRLSESPRRRLVQTGEGFHEADFSEEIHELIQIIKRFLKIERVIEDDFVVYGQVGKGLLSRLRKQRAFGGLEIRLLENYLYEFESHFIPRENVIYLSSLSMNHAATQAAIFLHAQLSGFSRVFREPRDDFYPFVWVEALGFLGSKIINHKRKCKSRDELERFIRAVSGKKLVGETKTNVEVAKAVISRLNDEMTLSRHKGVGPVRFPKAISKNKSVLFHYKEAKLLGQLLGEALYRAMMDNNISRGEVSLLFANPFNDTSDAARKLYFNWIRRLDSFGYRKARKVVGSF